MPEGLQEGSHSTFLLHHVRVIRPVGFIAEKGWEMSPSAAVV